MVSTYFLWPSFRFCLQDQNFKTITIIRFFLVNYNPLGLPTVLKSINPNQSFNHYQVPVHILLSKNVNHRGPKNYASPHVYGLCRS